MCSGCPCVLADMACVGGFRWDGDNGPQQSDFVAVRNLLAATPRSVRRFVLTTSAGVERQGSFPFVILNLFGALLPGCAVDCKPVPVAAACQPSVATVFGE